MSPRDTERGVRKTLTVLAVIFVFLAVVVGSTLLGGGGAGGQPQTHTMRDGWVMNGDMRDPSPIGR